MVKWIGGATAAVVLAFAGATIAGDMVAPAKEAPAPSLVDAIPVDQAALTKDNAAEADKAAMAATEARLEKASDKKPVDQQFVVKRILDIKGPIKYGQYFWDDKGVPDGPIVMTVDLDARVLSVFRDGYEIGAAAVLLGTDEYPTPLGTFPILRKQRYNVSEKYGNAPMPWSMFLTRDGVAIHGGHAVENGYASHGCISGPDGFVSKIFAIAKPGDKVIITRGKMMTKGDSIL